MQKDEEENSILQWEGLNYDTDWHSLSIIILSCHFDFQLKLHFLDLLFTIFTKFR